MVYARKSGFSGGNAQTFMFDVESMARLVPAGSRVDRVLSTTFGRYRCGPRGNTVYAQVYLLSRTVPWMPWTTCFNS